MDPSSASPATFSQLVRLFAFKLADIAANDYIVASDSDILPLQRSIWREKRNRNRLVHSLNAFCCSALKQQADGSVVSDEGFYDPELHSIDEDERVLHMPVCSVGAVKTVWNDLLGTGTGDWNASALKNHVVALMEENLGQDRAHRRAFAKETDLPAWYTDQTLLSAALHYWRHFPDQVELVARNTQVDRIDRLLWKVPGSREQLARFVDAHLPQPSYDDLGWSQVLPLLQLIFSPDDVEKFQMYRDDFVRALQRDAGN